MLNYYSTQAPEALTSAVTPAWVLAETVTSFDLPVLSTHHPFNGSDLYCPTIAQAAWFADDEQAANTDWPVIPAKAAWTWVLPNIVPAVVGQAPGATAISVEQ